MGRSGFMYVLSLVEKQPCSADAMKFSHSRADQGDFVLLVVHRRAARPRLQNQPGWAAGK